MWAMGWEGGVLVLPSKEERTGTGEMSGCAVVWAPVSIPENAIRAKADGDRDPGNNTNHEHNTVISTH